METAQLEGHLIAIAEYPIEVLDDLCCKLINNPEVQQEAAGSQ